MKEDPISNSRRVLRTKPQTKKRKEKKVVDQCMYVKEKQARETHLHIHKSQMTEHRGGSFFPHNYLITHTFTSCSQSKTDLINVPSPSVSEPSHLCPSSPGMIQYLVH